MKGVIKEFKKSAHQNLNIYKKTFVITGSFQNIKRENLIQTLEESGGIVRNSISNKIDYLVAGEKAGSKLDKAKNLGTKIISEEDLKILLNKKEK